MTISGKYELLLPLGVDGFRSFHARHLITGQAVMVHFLEAGQRYEPGPPGVVYRREQLMHARRYWMPASPTERSTW